MGYYDSPEGEECFQKMGYLTKNAALFGESSKNKIFNLVYTPNNNNFDSIAGVFVATGDILFISHPKGYLKTAGRFVYYTVPLSAMAAAFAATSCVANTVRGKDDPLNYVIGGLSSAAIMGAWKQCVTTGIRAGIVFSLAGYLKKKSIQEGWSFIEEPVRQKRMFDTRKYDFSMLKGKY